MSVGLWMRAVNMYEQWIIRRNNIQLDAKHMYKELALFLENFNWVVITM